MEIMGCPFAPLGLMFSAIYNFRGFTPAIFLRPFRSLDRDMTELIVFPRAGSGLQPA